MDKQVEYTFCYTKDSTQRLDLIMLSSSENIMTSLCQQSHQQVIWLNSYKNTQTHELIKEIEEKFSINIVQISTKRDIIHYIDSLTQEKNIILVIEGKMKEEIQSFGLKEKIRHFVAYWKDNIVYYNKIQEDSFSESVNTWYFDAQSKQELIQIIQKLTMPQKNYKILPNFIFMHDEISKSNLAIRSLYAGINHSLNSDLRSQIVVQLKALLIKLSQKQNIEGLNLIENFISELNLGKLSINRALHWYTINSPIYKLTNNLLRLSLHPAQIYYIQPFLKDLFDSVRTMHEIHLNSGKIKLKNFICYRGANLSAIQINNLITGVNKVVQNLGFLSTSMDLQIAKGYAQNAIFEIEVKDVPRNQQIDFGYAFIKQRSYYFDEEEVLFNPLNTFLIREITQKYYSNQKIIYLKMEYGYVANIICSKNLSRKQIDSIFSLGYHQIQSKRKVLHQRDVLNFTAGVLKGTKNYWKKHIQLSTRLHQKLICHINLAQILIQNGELQESWLFLKQYQQVPFKQHHLPFRTIKFLIEALVKYYQKSWKYQKAIALIELLLNYLPRSQENFNEEYLQYSTNLAILYLNMGNYSKAESIFNKILQFSTQNEEMNSQVRCNLLSRLSFFYNAKGQYKKSLSMKMQTLSISMTIEGCDSLNYAKRLLEVGCAYLVNRNYDQSEIFLTKCMATLQKFPLKTHKVYREHFLQCCIRIARIFYLKSNVRGAINIYHAYLQQFLRQQIDFNLKLTVIHEYEQASFQFKNQDKIILIYLQIIQFIEKNVSVNHINYTTAHSLLGKLYTKQRKYQEAIKCFQICQRLNDKNGRLQSQGHAFILQNMTEAYFYLKEYKKALCCIKKSVKIWKNFKQNKFYDLARSIYTTVLAESFLENYSQGIQICKKLLTKYLTIRQKGQLLQQIHDEMYVAVMHIMFQNYICLGNYFKVIDYVDKQRITLNKIIESQTLKSHMVFFIMYYLHSLNQIKINYKIIKLINRLKGKKIVYISSKQALIYKASIKYILNMYKKIKKQSIKIRTDQSVSYLEF